jgi:peptidoglycan/LPS O-acetylase OafA/YrhL
MSISAVNVIPAMLVMLLAMGSALLLRKFFNPATEQGRFVSIDGLRGYLAVFVFIHHACIWYFYLRTGDWAPPPSNPYTVFGEAAVGFFFMITGFLFFNKIIQARTKGMDWFGFFVSRLMRLGPLYFAVLCCLFAIVAVVSQGELRDTPWHLAKGISRWLIFTMLGSPNLNNFGHTSSIVAGVTWSLTYEWFFYLMLPAIAACAGMSVPIKPLSIGVIATVLLYFWGPEVWHLFAFLCGMGSAVVHKTKFVATHGPRWYSSVLILSSLALTCALSPTAYTALPLLIMFVSFLMMVSGNTLFGLLSNSTAIFLGDLAYGIYLLHGLVLFVLFNFAFTPSFSRQFSPLEHWLLVAMASPLLIVLTYACSIFIEKPGVRSTSKLTAWIRNRLQANSSTYRTPQ